MAQATITFTLSQTDFDGIIDMAGYGVGHWASYMKSTPAGCHFTDAESGDKFFITREKLEQAALDLFVTAPLNDYYQEAIGELVLCGNAGEVGSDIADAIVQQAIFGGVIWG